MSTQIEPRARHRRPSRDANGKSYTYSYEVKLSINHTKPAPNSSSKHRSKRRSSKSYHDGDYISLRSSRSVHADGDYISRSQYKTISGSGSGSRSGEKQGRYEADRREDSGYIARQKYSRDEHISHRDDNCEVGFVRERMKPLEYDGGGGFARQRVKAIDYTPPSFSSSPATLRRNVGFDVPMLAESRTRFSDERNIRQTEDLPRRRWSGDKDAVLRRYIPATRSTGWIDNHDDEREYDLFDFEDEYDDQDGIYDDDENDSICQFSSSHRQRQRQRFSTPGPAFTQSTTPHTAHSVSSGFSSPWPVEDKHNFAQRRRMDEDRSGRGWGNDGGFAGGSRYEDEHRRYDYDGRGNERYEYGDEEDEEEDEYGYDYCDDGFVNGGYSGERIGGARY